MKIALLHFEYRANKVKENVAKIIIGIHKAAEAGANWVMTPEMAVQGYFFADGTVLGDDIAPLMDLVPLMAAAFTTKTRLFVGALEKEGTKNFYNSCYVISKDGDVDSTQRKATGHNVGAEAWSVKNSPIMHNSIDGIDTGILVCSDSWYEDKQQLVRGSDLVLVPAAWPNFDVGGGLPEDAWKKCSLTSGAMVIACNQTGHNERMDMDSSRSAVVSHGDVLFDYAGNEAILLLDVDASTKNMTLKASEIIKIY